MDSGDKYSSLPSEDQSSGGKDDPKPNQWGFSKFGASESPREEPRASAPAVPASPAVPAAMVPKRRKPVERKLNFSELIKVMYRGRWVVLTAFVIAFTYTVYSTYSKPYIYGSSARMFIDRPKGGSEVAQIIGGPTSEDHSMANEMLFFKSHIVGSHVGRLLHQYAEGNLQEIDSLFTDAFHSAKDVPPDPRQLAVIRMVDNPKLKQLPGIPDTATLEERASQAVNIAAEASNDYLDVSSEAYTPLDAAFLCNLYIACFVKDDRVARARKFGRSQELSLRAKRTQLRHPA